MRKGGGSGRGGAKPPDLVRQVEVEVWGSRAARRVGVGAERLAAARAADLHPLPRQAQHVGAARAREQPGRAVGRARRSAGAVGGGALGRAPSACLSSKAQGSPAGDGALLVLGRAVRQARGAVLRGQQPREPAQLVGPGAPRCRVEQPPPLRGVLVRLLLLHRRQGVYTPPVPGVDGLVGQAAAQSYCLYLNDALGVNIVSLAHRSSRLDPFKLPGPPDREPRPLWTCTCDKRMLLIVTIKF